MHFHAAMLRVSAVLICAHLPGCHPYRVKTRNTADFSSAFQNRQKKSYSTESLSQVDDGKVEALEGEFADGHNAVPVKNDSSDKEQALPAVTPGSPGHSDAVALARSLENPPITATPVTKGNGSTVQLATQSETSSKTLQAKGAPARAHFSLVSAVACKPHPDKLGRNYSYQPAAGGEDSYFIGDQVVGVADGVGGWESMGVDSGKYSRELMKAAEAAARDGELDPATVLKRAHGQTAVLGSSTAVIVALNAVEGSLKAANLGDSGFVVLRGKQVIFESKAQQHGWNYPYQLAAPGTVAANDADLPKDAEILTVPGIQAGDVVVLGSDGLLDNMFMKDIVEVVSLTTSSFMGDYVQKAINKDGIRHSDLAQAIADGVAARASANANDATRNGPFSNEARLQGVPFFGGKLDDITVVVGLVTERE